MNELFKYDVGSLVELDDGVRLYVVYHGYDCDGTPLYYLSYDRNDTVKERKHFKNSSWAGGFAEKYLKLINTTQGTQHYGKHN